MRRFAKKILSITVALLLVAIMTFGTAFTSSAATYAGDVDGDGRINSLDLSEVRQFLLGLKNDIDDELKYDTNGDGKVNLKDLVCVKKLAVSFETDDKFVSKFTNANYIYRVGNQNKVAVGSIFAVKDNVNKPYVNEVVLTISNLTGDANGVYTAHSSDWDKGTIQFSGTGLVEVTIQEDTSAPLKIKLEVVDAVNATSATSATTNNVVLLNDISGTFVVSNGHTFYGNGFKVTLPTSSVQNIGNGFTGYISVGASQDDGIANGGNLDNVRIIGPVYPEMYIYRDQAKITDKNDPDYIDAYNMRYFKNSVIIYGGNCTISNSYISGSRTAVCVRAGNNIVIENTTLSGGAYANMQVCAASSITLRDLTTVQVDVLDSYGKGKTAHGLGIAIDSNIVELYIEGELNQHNWLCKEQWDRIVPSTYQSAFPKFFTDSSFNKYWHYLNGSTAPYVNLGFIFACEWDIAKINDNRETVDYATVNATISGVAGGVYTKVNTVGGNAITETELLEPVYVSPGFNPIAPSLKFDNSINADEDDANDASDTYCVYNESIGVLKLGISSATKDLDLSGLKVVKNGVELGYKLKFNGNEVTGNSITVDPEKGTKQTLTITASTNDAGYDKDGNPIVGTIQYSWNITIEVAKLEFPAPEWNMGDNYEFGKSNLVYAYYATTSGYGEAVQIYEGIKVNYYDKSGKLIEKDFSGTTAIPTGSNNSNSNAFTYPLGDGSTLTMKFLSGWKSGATTHQFTVYNNKVYIYPQSLDNDNYIRAKVTNQDFDVKINYTFTDPNGQTTTQVMRWYNPASSNSSVSTVQWKKFDSTNGKSSCVTPDTLVTLADGTKKEIQDVTYQDKLLVWDFVKGEYTETTSAIVMNHGYGCYDVLTLNFADGTTVKTINGHGFFDSDANKFVIIDTANVAENVGKNFTTFEGAGTKLVSYSVSKEYTESWSILTASYYNCILEGMLTVTPGEVEGSPDYLMPFVVGDDMKYDEAAMKGDIEKYGLYTYEDFSDYITLEVFDALGLKNFKVAVGKGYITYDEILYLLGIHF